MFFIICTVAVPFQPTSLQNVCFGFSERHFPAQTCSMADKSSFQVYSVGWESCSSYVISFSMLAVLMKLFSGDWTECEHICQQHTSFDSCWLFPVPGEVWRHIRMQFGSWHWGKWKSRPLLAYWTRDLYTKQMNSLHQVPEEQGILGGRETDFMRDSDYMAVWRGKISLICILLFATVDPNKCCICRQLNTYM